MQTRYQLRHSPWAHALDRPVMKVGLASAVEA
jgi:hypothetical protein